MRLKKIFVGTLTAVSLLSSGNPAFAENQLENIAQSDRRPQWDPTFRDQYIVKPEWKGVVQTGNLNLHTPYNQKDSKGKLPLTAYNHNVAHRGHGEGTIEVKPGTTYQKFDLWVYDGSGLYDYAVAPANVFGSKVELVRVKPDGKEIHIAERTTDKKGKAFFQVKTNLKAKETVTLHFRTLDKKVLYTLKLVST